jgi:hypothetical protein
MKGETEVCKKHDNSRTDGKMGCLTNSILLLAHRNVSIYSRSLKILKNAMPATRRKYESEWFILGRQIMQCTDKHDLTN